MHPKHYSGVGDDLADHNHQENAESASTKLKALGTRGVPYKRLEALSVLTVNSKRVEAHRIAAEHSFSSLTCPVDTGFRRSG